MLNVVSVIITVERRRDGKLHTVGGRLLGDDWDKAVAYAHALRCEEGLSY
jgi:hypothetical protein